MIESSKNGYENSFIFTFLYGRQIATFLEYINIDNSSDEYINKIEDDIKKNLNFIFNSFVDSEIRKAKREKFEKKAAIKDQIELIILFFEKIFEYNNFSFNDLFINHLIIEKEEENHLKEFKNSKNEILSGVYIYKFKTGIKDNIYNEINIVELSIKLTHNIPLGSTLLICHKYTTSEEIIAFIYRFIKCEYKTPFFIANFHLISNENKVLVYNLFKQLENYTLNALLIFLLPINNEEEEIISGFKFFKQNILKNKNTDNIIIDNYEINTIIQNLIDVDIISSNCSGIGKTTIIKNFAEENNFNIITFPFGLEETRLSIINRLNNVIKELESKKTKNNKTNVIGSNKSNKMSKNDIYINKILLHVNIYDIKSLDYINEFLFCLLFTKIFR